ncbi:MAG: hypothetical protein ACRCWA_00400 [Clostridium butyricum]
MGNIIKINMYVESKNKNKKYEMNLDNIEKKIKQYNKWLEKTEQKDHIENFHDFLQM